MNVSATAPTTGDAGRYLAQYDAAEPSLPGEFSELRLRGRDRFQAVGFPGPREESWRFTRLGEIARREFAHALSGQAADLDRLRPRIAGSPVSEEAVRAVFVNGRYVPGLSTLEDQTGVRVGSLLNEDDPKDLSAHLGEVVDLDRHRFAALNTAFLHDAAIVTLGPGATPQRPIHLLFLEDSPVPQVVYPRVLIRMESGAKATVVEEYRSSGESGSFTCAVSEVLLEENSSLEHVRLQGEAQTAFHIGSVTARLSRDARYASRVLSLGGRLTRLDLDVILDGEGAECDLDGLYVPGGSQHVDHHTRVEHRRPHTVSRELYKGVLDGQSTGVFNGRVVIQAGTSGIDAAQTNNNLLLSGDALVNTNPELEILADDVKAQHGATVGRLDEEQMFYLRSRGIEEDESRRLLIRAFCGQVLDRVGLAEVRDSLRQELERRF